MLSAGGCARLGLLGPPRASVHPPMHVRASPICILTGLYTGMCTCMARAHTQVRLGLLGPLASVGLQQQIMGDVLGGGTGGGAALDGSAALDGTGAPAAGLLDVVPHAEAAGSAPLLEAAHACHDLLERRIFQT